MSNNAMSNETDLDWLARNVHVWPAGDHQPWCYVYWKGGYRAVSGNCITVIQPCVRVEMSQWLARRSELQNKPSFAGHPDAKCFVQNDSGTWFKNRNSTNVRPESDGGWFDRDMSCGWTQLGAGEVLGDWRDTLEKRPADLSEQSVTARLKEATDNVLAAAPELMTDKYKFEPFVGVEDEHKVLSELEMLAKVSHLVSDKRHRITPSKYTKTIHGVPVDVYDVPQAWGVINPALQHLIKKALQCGQRGHKDNAQDLQDIIDSAIRAKELG